MLSLSPEVVEALASDSYAVIKATIQQRPLKAPKGCSSTSRIIPTIDTGILSLSSLLTLVSRMFALLVVVHEELRVVKIKDAPEIDREEINMLWFEYCVGHQHITKSTNMKWTLNQILI